MADLELRISEDSFKSKAESTSAYAFFINIK